MPCNAPICAYADLAFQRMKASAVAAGWPADLSPRVVTLDKTWQWQRTQAVDEARVRALAEEMGALATALAQRKPAPAVPAAPATRAKAAAARALAPQWVPVPELAPAPPAAPPSAEAWYESPWAIGGFAAGGLMLALGLIATLARSKSAPLSGARRRRR